MVQPMLAGKLDFKRLDGTYMTQPKLDGIRAICRGGRLYSRTMKPIPNEFCQSLAVAGYIPNGLDGELIVGNPTAKDVFQKTTSGVMSVGGTPDVKFYAFDLWNQPLLLYANRRIQLREEIRSFENDFLVDVETLAECYSISGPDKEIYEIAIQDYLRQGFEGLIARDVRGLYKYGRSTSKEGHLLKWKVWEDEEAEVVGFEELMHNGNAAFVNETGHTKRSAHQDGKIPGGMLGALVVRSPKYSGTFNIGSGFDMALRQLIWDNRSQYLGKNAKFKHFPIGQKDLPRHPIFLGFRDERDM